MDFATLITNHTTTLNGAVSNRSSLNACLDLFSMGVSASNKEQLIRAALAEDPLLATKVVFYLRDCRQGQGNKDILQAFFDILFARPVDTPLLKVLEFIPMIGYWKDLVKLTMNHPQALPFLLPIFRNGLRSENPGLCAKWLPRKGPMANELRKYLGLTPKEYRHLLVNLSNTVEQQICANKWSNVDYKSVPSRANKLYANAFLAHDTERRQAFLAKVMTGETKMNSGQLYPHEIVNSIRSNRDAADAMWKSLPNYMSNAVNVLPVIDTSGSMGSVAGGTTVSCLSIAVALGIYFSEHNTGSYKDVWCNFSHKPSFYKLQGTTLSQRVANLDYSNWHNSTNLQAVFDLILQVYVNNKEAIDNLPKMVLIVSDMEFNNCGRTHNLDVIKAKYHALGLIPPTIVFWRVDVKSAQQPATFLDDGTVLINGFSPAILKELLAGNIENFTPLSLMMKAIGDKYDYLDNLFK